MPILAILAYFWPVFSQFWGRYQYQWLETSIFVVVLTRLSVIGKKILNDSVVAEKNADFGNFSPFLACFLANFGPGLSDEGSE